MYIVTESWLSRRSVVENVLTLRVLIEDSADQSNRCISLIIQFIVPSRIRNCVTRMLACGATTRSCRRRLHRPYQGHGSGLFSECTVVTLKLT